MQRVILFLLVILSGTFAHAQSISVAVLTSGQNVTTFYGNSALIKACQAANNGDVITLSPGVFVSPVEISKALTIKGAGMDKDSGNCSRITANSIILNNGDQEVLTMETVLENLCIDGNVYHRDSRRVKIRKCFIYSLIQDYDEATSGSLELSNCHVRGEVRFLSLTMVTNSVFGSNMNIISTENHHFSNCVFNRPTPNSTIDYSIFIQEPGDGSILPESTSTTGCKYIGSQPEFFRYQTTDNEVLSKETTVFKENSFYELTDEYAAKWLDKDNSQIGLYGGPEPFSMIPSNPRIIKFNVASKTSADGKLSVDIEVANPTK